MKHHCSVLIGLLLACGCGGGGDPLFSVSGTVTYKGQPVEGADVSFVPTDDGPAARPARGRTDDSGRFYLETYLGPGDDASGARPGDYAVTIQKIVEPEGGVDPYQGRVAKNELPARYANSKQPVLTAAVSPDGANEFEFELTDKP